MNQRSTNRYSKRKPSVMARLSIDIAHCCLSVSSIIKHLASRFFVVFWDVLEYNCLKTE